MKNFPSALIKQQNTKNNLGNNLGNTLKNIGTHAISNIFKGGKPADLSKSMDKNFNAGYLRREKSMQLDEINILNNKSEINDLIQARITNNFNIHQINQENNNKFRFEDQVRYSSQIFSAINNYKYVFAHSIPSLIEKAGLVSGNKEYGITILEQIQSPSLFNPYNTISSIGIVENIPLIDRETAHQIEDQEIEPGVDYNDHNTFKGGEINKKLTLKGSLNSKKKDLSDCSIHKLVELSQDGESELGLATYRYIDFAFCKDLGKFSNNHLITLRKFPMAVGDDIFHVSSDPNDINRGIPDIGRLVTWFGNEDNKLEDICRYTYRASWKEFTSEIDNRPSEQQDNGIFDKLANFMSASNNELVGRGFSSNTGLINQVAGALNIPILSQPTNPSYNWELLSNYDKHRIYEPTDRVWDTHQYEGRLEFNQEITLVFRYVLRSYYNINPKNAFLDLLGNIHTVTYRRGTYWAGENRVYGPQGDSSVYNKGLAFVDDTFDKLGGIFQRFANGAESNLNYDTLVGWLGSMCSVMGNGLESITSKAQNVINNLANGDTSDVKNTVNTLINIGRQGTNDLIDLNDKTKFTDAIRGMFKNYLGRPAIYAFNSLLTGDNVGPWHLTVGNPRNPILAIGNLIMDDFTEIEHSGPLGIDDFPTELKVTVRLKPAMSRDAVNIQKMYTKGLRSIYTPMSLVEASKYYQNPMAFGDVINNIDDGGKSLKIRLSSV